MTGEDAQQEWERLRTRLQSASAGTKDSQMVVIELSRRYSALNVEERSAVDRLLTDWVRSADYDLRFDALTVISDHRIQSALPALRELAHRLEGDPGPAAPYEWAKVNRLIGHLTGEEA